MIGRRAVDPISTPRAASEHPRPEDPRRPFLSSKEMPCRTSRHPYSSTLPAPLEAHIEFRRRFRWLQSGQRKSEIPERSKFGATYLIVYPEAESWRHNWSLPRASLGRLSRFGSVISTAGCGLLDAECASNKRAIRKQCRRWEMGVLHHANRPRRPNSSVLAHLALEDHRAVPVDNDHFEGGVALARLAWPNKLQHLISQSTRNVAITYFLS